MINLVTALIRPQHVPLTYAVIKSVLPSDGWHWWIVHDLDHTGPGPAWDSPIDSRVTVLTDHPHPTSNPQAHVRNAAYKQITEGWIYTLDDDTKPHETLAANIQVAENMGMHLVRWPCLWSDGTMSNDITVPSGCDAAGFAYWAPAFRGFTWPDYGQDEDARAYQSLFSRCDPARRLYMEKPGAWYNYWRSTK